LIKINKGDFAEKILAKALKSNTTLKQLYLLNANISDAGAVALAEAQRILKRNVNSFFKVHNTVTSFFQLNLLHN
tara:strand:- start:129 stop:353 length:225 start_codon:yes stop_codon:yes gene_type:complete